MKPRAIVYLTPTDEIRSTLYYNNMPSHINISTEINPHLPQRTPPRLCGEFEFVYLLIVFLSIVHSQMPNAIGRMWRECVLCVLHVGYAVTRRLVDARIKFCGRFGFAISGV